MKANREPVLAEILHTEAGYAERTEEGGGAVNRGITFAKFQAVRGLKGQTVTWEDLKNMTKEEAIDIYTTEYLMPIRFDDLPSGVDYCMLDAAVNNGVTGSIKILQEALGFPEDKCDGHFGAVTQWAMKHRVVPDLINRLCDERIETDKTFPRWNKALPNRPDRTWGQVWSDRVAKVRPHALAMAGVSAAPAPAEPAAEPPAAETPKPVLTPIVPSPYINRLGMDLLLEGWTKEGFAKYVEEMVAPKMSAWRPQGVVLHCTDQPSLKTWDEDMALRKITPAQRIANMVPLWQKRGFKSSPHLFGDRTHIWTATPLWKRGTGSPSFNLAYWHFETVGDYASIPGEVVPDSQRDLVAHAVACLFLMLGREPTPTTLRYHGEDPLTTHRNCPGHAMGPKEDWDRLIEAKMAELAPGEHYVRD